MKNPSLSSKAVPKCRELSRIRSKGFALVISLMLMALLVILGVGMLTLSSKTLSISDRQTDLSIARSNARLALSMAVAQLQRHSGPDQRITTTADQLASGQNPEESAAAPERRHWTGIYKSWQAGVKQRPEPEFCSWLVSGDPDLTEDQDAAKGSGGNGVPVELVGRGTMGDVDEGFVEVPPLHVSTPDGGSARIAWWTGDQGTKAALATPPAAESQELAAVRAAAQGAPRNAVELARAGGEVPFADLELSDSRIQRVTDWNQAAFLAVDKDSPRGLFHDLAPFSTGLITNVRSGGFRKDLSMHLERPSSDVPRDPLYVAGGKSGINEAELWLHYNMYKELKTRGRYSFTTGGTMGSSSPYLQVEGNQTAMLNDAENFYKQPAFVSYQTVLSFHSRTVTSGGSSKQRLCLVVDPIVTYWNPLDVPVVLTPAYNSIKFWQLPYDLSLRLPGKSASVSLMSALGGGAFHYLTLIAGAQQPIVLKPGEVMMVSQGPSTPITQDNPELNYVQGRAGWNFGGGISIDLKDSTGNFVEGNSSDTLTYSLRPNSAISDGTRHWSLNHHETYYKEDRSGRGESVGIGGVFIDYIYGLPHDESNPKPTSLRLRAANFPDFFGKISSSDTRPLKFSQLSGRKEPFMIYSYNVKTEKGSDRGGRFLSRFNPKAMLVDFYDLSEQELDLLPFEVQIQPLDSWKNRNLEVSPRGNGYFGGGMNAEFGTSFISTHSVPREPLYSLAAFQHAFANGFSSNNPQAGYAIVNARFPMLPHVSHPIGNSLAPSVIAPNRTEAVISGPRVLADHSYLANEALWDDWFLSGIAPQIVATFSPRRSQKQVAEEFLDGTAALPVTRYLPDTGGEEPEELLSRLFRGSLPTDDATLLTASLIRVDGLFNVNSTSVEAWKAVLGSLKGRPIAVRDANGAESVTNDHDGGVPVAGLLSPEDAIAKGQGAVDVKEPEQWTGRRTLSEDDIDSLARGIVREVRKRGPFLSLADFVNRRVGSDEELARCGAVQAALDSPEVSVNEAYNAPDRSVPSSVGSRFAFADAETGPAAYGIPGIVKQADILTPIAPVLSVRSDSFVVRAYGEAVGKDGEILARAWCEAIVERDKNFVDSSEEADTRIASLKVEANRHFGRRYRVSAFRWLHPDEV